MPTFSNTAQIEAYIRNAIDDVIRKEVFDAIRDVWLETQYEKVYMTYEPTKYSRREDDGGLNDPDNIILNAPANTGNITQYVLENITKGNGWDEWNGKLINDMIESSDGFAGNPLTGMPARPYTQETVEEITNGVSRDVVKTALQNGLRRHGLTINIK